MNHMTGKLNVKIYNGFQQISPNLALRVLLQFDRAINQALASKVRSRITFKASKLNTYRFCDNVWTFLMSEVDFKEIQDFAQVDKLKIVACDGRGEEARQR